MPGLLRGTEVKARNGLDLSLQSCEFVGVSRCPILRIRNMKLKAPWQGLASWDNWGYQRAVHILTPPFTA